MARRLKAPAWWAVGLTALFVCGSLLPDVTFFSDPQSYLPLHITLELVSMAISLMVVAIAWSLRNIEDNSRIVVLGGFSLAILLIDLAHTLSYAGMPALVTESGAEKAVFFWLSSRLVAAIGLLVVAVIPVGHWRVRRWIPLIGVALLVSAVVWWLGLTHLESMPRTFIPGQGLTTFKVNAEYAIAAIYAVAAVLLTLRLRRREGMDSAWLATAAWTLALAELFLTLYANVTDIFNLLGHVYKAIAYLMIYKAVFVAGVRQPQQQLVQEKARLRSLIDSVPDLVSFRDHEGRFIGANAAFANLMGVPESGLVGRLPSELPGAPNTEIARRKDAAVLGTGSVQRYEERILRTDGSGGLFDTVETPYFAPTGETLGIIKVSRDITEQNLSEERIHHLALYDQLTGLANRLLLRDRVTEALSADSSRPLALIFVDLDDFKMTNDTVGHQVGDLILCEAGRRIAEFAAEHETAARLGGDEFALLALDVDSTQAADLASRILTAFGESFHLGGYELAVTPSIGIAMGPADGMDVEALLRSADAAMFRAKQEGHNTYRFFTEGIQALSVRKLQIMAALRKAIDNDELSVLYQPQVALSDGRILGAEALIRWMHPDFGAIEPNEFIGLAESGGLILPIGDWVLGRALANARCWQVHYGRPLTVAVNISAVQFLQNDLPARIAAVLQETAFPPELLELEITESVAMRNPDSAAVMLRRLHDLGVTISIDDFGTGYSSMAYLKRFQIDRLKIDQSFVANLESDPDNAAIVRAVIQLAQSLRCTTVAEGVETAAERDYLEQSGCDAVQGYFFSRPVRQEQFVALLKRSATPVAG
jgi:diguanylate cyclase (GGDEF)-like protein/PAS domain S-box-containing protein